MQKARRVSRNVYAFGSSLVYRRQVPADVRAPFGQTEIKRRLGPVDLRTAQIKARTLDAEFDVLFARLRDPAGLIETEAAILSAATTATRDIERAFFNRPRDAEDLPALYEQRRAIEAEVDRQAEPVRQAAATALDAKLSPATRARQGDGAAILKTRRAAQMLARLVGDLLQDDDAEEALDLSRARQRREHGADISDEEADFRQEWERTKLDKIGRQASQEVSELDAIIGIALHDQTPSGERIVALDDERRKKKALSPVTAGKYDYFQRRWTNLFGDCGVRGITRAQVEQYVDAIAGLPNANFLPPNQRQLSVDELLTLRAERDVPSVDAYVVVKHLDWIRAVLGYAVDGGLIHANPAKGVKAPTSSKAYAARRRPFSSEQLREVVIVAEDVWKDDDRLWLLRVCAYSGMRPGEAVQLEKVDIKRASGVDYFDVHDLGDKTTKNAASVRRVPVHPRLLELGFAQWTDNRNTRRLFDFEYEFATRAFVEIVLPKCKCCLIDGVRDKRLVWYSLRHSFADACRNGSVGDDARRALMGHTEDGIAGVYGSGFGLKKLAAEISKVDPLAD